MKTRGLQPKLLYPARLSIKLEGQIRRFPDKRSLKEYTSSKPALQEMLKGLLKEKRQKREEHRYQKMAMNKYLSIITLNVNELKPLMFLIKTHRITEWIRRNDAHICCLQETHLRTKELHIPKVKGWKQIFQANGQEKKKLG